MFEFVSPLLTISPPFSRSQRSGDLFVKPRSYALVDFMFFYPFEVTGTYVLTISIGLNKAFGKREMWVFKGSECRGSGNT